MRKPGWMAMAGGLIAGNLLAAGLSLPEPQSGMIVLPKGQERSAHPGQAFMGGGVEGATLALGFVWNADGLQTTFDCTDESVVAAQGDIRDNPNAWKDDCVELLLDPGHRHGVPVLVRVSAAGALWDSRGPDSRYNIDGLKSEVVRTATGWRARMEIPWKGLGVAEPRDGEVWGLNIRRINHAGAFTLTKMADGSWMPQTTEPQDVLGSGHVGFILPASAENDAKLAAMRRNLEEGHSRTVRAWAGPNDGDVVSLAGEPVKVPWLGRVASGAAARQATQVTVSRDDSGLEVNFDCEDEDVFAVQQGRDCTRQLWKDDCVYVWLDPAHDHKGMIMVQVSAAGVVVDSKDRDDKWNLEGMIVDARRTKQGWSARLVMPWKGLGVAAPKDGDVWGFNLSRMDQPGTYDFRLMQMAAMTIIPAGDLGQMHRWGHLAFGKGANPAKAPVHVALKKAVDEQIAANAAAEKTEAKRLAALRGLPANANASEDVHKIVKWLTELPARKGNRFILGNDIWCYDTIGGKTGMDAGFDRFIKAIHDRTGKWLPMIHVSYNDPLIPHPVHPFSVKDANRHAIAYWKAGGFVHIHINPVNPWTGNGWGDDKGLAQRERIAEVIQPGTAANQVWMKKLDAYAALLAELRDAGVVVFWRPLHEMGFDNCYWYDWGATRRGDEYKAIWRHMFKYFSEEKKLDNLVWVWGGGGTHSLEMYPGPEYVDMVGFSHYGSETVRPGNEYEHMLKYGKPISFTEFGPGGQEEPAYDNLNLIRAVREQYPMMVSATYWHSWHGVRTAIADCRNVEALMNHPWVMDRDELDWRAVKVDIEKSRARGSK